MSNRKHPELKYDAETEAWFKNKPKWTVTTVCICEKCGLAYKPSIGHKAKNCKVMEVDSDD